MAKNKSGFEIERVFLVKSFPYNFRKCPHVRIEQGYLAIAEDREIRLRKESCLGVAWHYFLTVKIGSGISRKEIDCQISKEMFQQFWPATVGLRLSKTRYFISSEAGKNVVELDIFHGKLKGYSHLEVEFKNGRLAGSFDVPDWFGLEVTNDKRHRNKYLVLHGIPKGAI